MEDLARPVFLLTDFGTRDHYAGQVRAVIHTRAPRSPLIDITHDAEPFAIDHAAWLLETALPVIPPDSVVMAIVDPGVGTDRAPLAVHANGRWFVGPDNGLLSPAFDDAVRETVRGTPAPVAVPLDAAVHRLENPEHRRHQVSLTFHARDVFAPAAAAIATGVPLTDLGPAAASVVLLPPFRGDPIAGGTALRGYIAHIDRYGNLITTVRASQVGPVFAVTIAGRRIVSAPTFDDVPTGELLGHVDSSSFVAVACNQGDAARVLGVLRGAPVMVEPV